jgi:hypothetical protein
VAPSTAVRAATLPRTGASIGALTALAAGLLALGWVLTGATRGRRREQLGS